MSQGLRLQAVEPTVFFVREGQSLGHVVRVKVDKDGGAGREAALIVRWAQTAARRCGVVEPGETTSTSVRDIREPGAVAFAVEVGGQARDRLACDWAPVRHWENILAHGSHHDLGTPICRATYTPAR